MKRVSLVKLLLCGVLAASVLIPTEAYGGCQLKKKYSSCSKRDSNGHCQSGYKTVRECK